VNYDSLLMGHPTMGRYRVVSLQGFLLLVRSRSLPTSPRIYIEDTATKPSDCLWIGLEVAIDRRASTNPWDLETVGDDERARRRASVKANSTEEASERVVTDPELANAIKFLAVSVVDRLDPPIRLIIRHSQEEP
jgi:hypothetical protein